MGPDVSEIWPDQCASPSPTGMIDGSRLTPSVRKPTNQDSNSRFPNPRVLPGATWATPPRHQKMRSWIRIFGGHLWPCRGRLGDPPRLPQGLPCGPSGTFWGLSRPPWILFLGFCTMRIWIRIFGATFGLVEAALGVLGAASGSTKIATLCRSRGVRMCCGPCQTFDGPGLGPPGWGRRGLWELRKNNQRTSEVS